MEKRTLVISGFPGIGKSYLFKNQKDMKVLDSDSSKFSWISPGVRNPKFPNNYIEHIKKHIGSVDIIMISSHKEVREALEKNDIKYVLIYPDQELKDEYIQRYKERGSDEKFINMMGFKWNDFMSELDSESFPIKIRLSQGQYLQHAVKRLLNIMHGKWVYTNVK